MSEMLKRLLMANGYWDEARGDAGEPGGSGDEGSDTDKGTDDPANANDTSADESKKGDKGKLDPEKAKLVKDVMKWKEAARTTQQTLSTLQAELDQIKGAVGDISVEDLKAIVQERKEKETRDLEAKGKYDQIVSQMKAENEKVVTSLKQQIESYSAENAKLKEQIDELTIGQAFGNSMWLRENSVLTPRLARKEFGEYFDRDENGELIGYTAPRGAKDRAPIVDANGNPKPFEEALEYLHNRHPDAPNIMKSKKKPGAGSGSQQGNGAGNKPTPTPVYGISRIKKGLKGK